MPDHAAERPTLTTQKLLVVAVYALAFLIWIAAATFETESQRPSPRPAIADQQQQPQSAPAAQQRESDQGGTHQTPFVVETHEGAPTPEISAQQAEDREQQASSERWTVASTIVIAAFTVVLAIATVFLGIATWRMYRATRALVTGADETAKRQLRAYVLCAKSARPSILIPLVRTCRSTQCPATAASRRPSPMPHCCRQCPCRPASSARHGDMIDHAPLLLRKGRGHLVLCVVALTGNNRDPFARSSTDDFPVLVGPRLDRQRRKSHHAVLHAS